MKHWWDKKRSALTEEDIEECKQAFEAFGDKNPVGFIHDCNNMLERMSWETGMACISYDSVIYFEKCVRWIEILPKKRRGEIILSFTKYFNRIREKVTKMKWRANELPRLLRIRAITQAPYEVVKAFFRIFPPEGIRWTSDWEWVELRYESEVAPFFAHPELHEYLRSYYKFEFYYKLSNFDIEPLIESIVKTGIEVTRPHDVRVVLHDLEYFYYSPKVHPIQILQLNLSGNKQRSKNPKVVTEEILCTYFQARQNILDCISSTHYGKKLGSILEQDLLSFVYDVVVSVKMGKDEFKEHRLSKLSQPTNVTRRSSRIRNINRNNFYHRKRKRDEHPFFGVDFYRKRKKAPY